MVAASEDFFRLLFAKRVLHNGVVFVSTQDQAKRRLIPCGQSVFVVVVDVQLKLPKIRMRQLANLQVDQNKSLQDRVIEDEVDVEMISVERDAFLP